MMRGNVRTAIQGLVVLAGVAGLGILILISNSGCGCGKFEAGTPAPATEEGKPPSGDAEATKPAAIPRLLDLGAGKCIPCKMMAPILDELKKEYAGRFEVEFIDVWQDPAAGQKYGVKMIPTQIFYDATGKELFRHEGFLAKDDILAKWTELGVTFADGQAPEPATEKGD
jgi:thioredoxin 1